MAELNARACAALVVADVLKGRSLTDSLNQRNSLVDGADRGLVSELAYGTCRWWYRLDSVLRKLTRKPFKRRDLDIHGLLAVGLYQLEFTRVPAHAAVSETAGAARTLDKQWAVAVINGVLRRYQRERDSLQRAWQTDPSARYAQPDWFIKMLRRDWPDRWQGILDGLLQRPPFTLRVNLQRTTRDHYSRQLLAAGMTSRPVDGIPSALIVDKPVAVDRLPGFSGGLVSVQDAGAQLAALILKPRNGFRILDACAAPGGKTGHLFEMAERLQITAMDIDPKRLQRVGENMQRLGYQAKLMAADVTQPDLDWAGEAFDRILLDAPCTATGVMRRHPDIKLLRRADDVAKLVAQQRDILNALWPRLKPGGKLLYATCSVLAAENEQQIEQFLKTSTNADIEDIGSYPGHKTELGLQTLPGEGDMDGFYYTLLTKN